MSLLSLAFDVTGDSFLQILLHSEEKLKFLIYLVRFSDTKAFQNTENDQFVCVRGGGCKTLSYSILTFLSVFGD